MKPAFFLIILMISSLSAVRVRAQEKVQSSGLEGLRFIQGDEEGNEKKALKAELMVSDSEKKAVEQIQKLIRKYKGTQLEPDLQFRLAELYMRRSKTDRFFELHRESATVVKLAPRLVKSASSRNSLTQAVDVYQYIQKKFPDYPQMDLVIFNHAFARQALGQDQEANRLYWVLVKQHADSPLIPDAHLAIGEIAFQKAEFQTALEQFDAIRKFPDSRVYPYGLYKAAWTRYNMRDATGGLKNLEEVVEYGNYIVKNHIEAKLDLRKEALSDMTLFYEDVYPAKNAYSYFHEQSGDADLPPTLLRLVELYERHGRYADEREVLSEFVDHLGDSDLMPDARNRMVLAADSLKQKDTAISDLESFASACAMRGAFAKAHPKDIGKCAEGVQKTSLLLAQKWLKIWNKNPYDATFADGAEKAFGIFLRYKRVDEESIKARFLYAELLFKRNKFFDASNEYAETASDAKKVDAKVAANAGLPQVGHDASYAACLSLEKAVNDKWSLGDEKKFNVLAHRYVEDYPKGSYRLEIEFKMAFLAYEKNRYDEAAPIFLRLGNQFAKEEKGVKAQDLYLDILNIKKDYASIRSYSKNLMKKDMPEDRRAKMEKISEQAHFLQIQGLEEKNDFKSALHEYQTFIKDNPNSDLAEKAHWNLVQLHYKTADNFGGAEAALEFANRFPKSELAGSALIRAAATFESMGQLDRAAEVLVKMAERMPDQQAKWKELAADYFAMSGHAPEARDLYKGLIAQAKNEDKAKYMEILEAFEKSYGDERTHASVVKQLIQSGVEPFAAVAKVDHLKTTFAESDVQAAFQESKGLLGLASLPPAEKAQVRLIQARILEDEFVKQSVKAKPDRLALVLAMKTEKLSKAEQAYQSVIRFGEPKAALEALEHLHKCFAHYAAALRTIAVPEGMTAQEAQAFQKELQGLIIPLEEKGVETLAQAVSFAKKSQMYDGTVDRLQDELDAINHHASAVRRVALTEPSPVIPVEDWSAK